MLIKKILFTLVVMCSSLSVEAKTSNIILIGLPGTGKGSISQHLVSEHGYYQICLGDLFREEIRKNTEFGIQIKNIVAKADYVDDYTSFNYLSKYIDDAISQDKPILFDGYPRSKKAQELLTNYLSVEKLVDDTIILSLFAPIEVLDYRVLGRLICSECNHVYHKKDFDKHGGECGKCNKKLTKRTEDTRKILHKRIKHYNENILPIIEALADNMKLITLDTSESIYSVLSEVESKTQMKVR
ncbi:MAG: AAA family ATPase [Francisellaceae bacterium]|nr:AAA family ATPase [Francisellaceae bacterium]